MSEAYLVFSNELGLQFSKGSWRAAEIAVIKASKVKQLDDKYLHVAPELVIEIDTKADLSEIKNPLGYYQEKTDELLNFGVQKVVWIFTDTRKVMMAEAGKKAWSLTDWTQDVEMIEGLNINLQKILEQKKIKS